MNINMLGSLDATRSDIEAGSHSETTEVLLTLLSQSDFTQVFFVPSKKINFYINNFKKYFSGRKIVIAKEITKIHEAFLREDIANKASSKILDLGYSTIFVKNLE